MYAVHASTHDVCKLAFTVQQITNWEIHIILSVPMHMTKVSLVMVI